MTDNLAPIRYWMRWLAALLAAGSAMLTFLFGLNSFGLVVAVCLVVASIGSAYLWPIVLDEFRSGRMKVACFVAVVTLVFSITDLTTNFGSMTFKRGADIQTAQMQNTRYGDVRQSIADKEATQRLLQERLARLEARSDWQPEKPVDAWRAEIAVMEGDKIFGPTRTKGCTDATLDESRTFCAGYASAKAGLAMALDHEEIMKQLAHSDAALETMRKDAAPVEKVQSGAALQNEALASMFTLSLKPSGAAQHWTDKGVAWLVALFLTIGALGLNLIAWTNKREATHFSVKRDLWGGIPAPKQPEPASSGHTAHEAPREVVRDERPATAPARTTTKTRGQILREQLEELMNVGTPETSRA